MPGGGPGSRPQGWTSRPTPDQAVARLAGRQHGVVTRLQLRRLGLTAREIDGRLTAGRLHRLHRGVYAVGHPAVSREGRWLAAVAACGAGAVLSHASAGAVWGLLPGHRWEEEPVDVSAPRGRAPRAGIRLHRVRALARADTTRSIRIPVTTPARTLLDLADLLAERQLRRAVNEALVQRRVSVGGLENQVRQATGRHGATRLRGLLATAAPTRSELEDLFLGFLREHGLPRPLVNSKLHGFEVDFLFPGPRLVVETDGGPFHGTPLARRRDAERDAQLAAAGYTVIRLPWHDVTAGAAATAVRLRAVLLR